MNTRTSMTDENIFDFLLTADFKPENNYSRHDMLYYLDQYKRFYWLMHDKRVSLQYTNVQLEKHIKTLDAKIDSLEKQLAEQGERYSILYNLLQKKLTWKQRLLGKIIF